MGAVRILIFFLVSFFSGDLAAGAAVGEKRVFPKRCACMRDYAAMRLWLAAETVGRWLGREIEEPERVQDRMHVHVCVCVPDLPDRVV